MQLSYCEPLIPVCLTIRMGSLVCVSGVNSLTSHSVGKRLAALNSGSVAFAFAGTNVYTTVSVG